MKPLGAPVDLAIPATDLQPVELPFGPVIYQTRHGQGISHDAAFVVETLRNEETDAALNMLELGCGNGIISIMLGHWFAHWQITAIEVQQHLAVLAAANATRADIPLQVHHADLRQWQQKPCEIIAANPPYYPVEAGRVSPITERAVSRHEVLCTLPDVLQAVARNLHPEKGRAYLLYPASRLGEIEKTGKKIDLHMAAEFSLGANQKRKVLVKLTRKALC
jgi:tRNA1(Val) A37 N6-methylase TrmN6